MKHSWIIRQIVRITYRHIWQHRGSVLLMLSLTALAFTAVFLSALHFLEMRGETVQVAGLLCSAHAAAAWLLTAFILSCCNAVLGRNTFRDKYVDLSLRLLYGGGPGFTVTCIVVESLLITTSALFVSLAAGEWWIPVLTNCHDMGRSDQGVVAGYLFEVGTFLIVFQLISIAGLPIYTLIRNTSRASFKSPWSQY